MTTEAALTKLLNNYISRTRVAELAGDDELAAVFQLRRDRLSALVGHRKHLADRRAAQLWRDNEVRARHHREGR